MSCLLTYAFSTYPQPIQTGASARISVGVFNPGANIYCSEIVVAVPVGTDATCLSTQEPIASLNTAKWTLTTSKIVDGLDLGLPGDTSYAQYTYSCIDKSDYLIDYSLVLSIVAQIDTPPGDFIYSVQETSGTDPSSLQQNTGTWTLSKSTPQFFLENLLATTPTTPTVPTTEFANGSPIRLAWESNGTWFQLFEKGNPAPIYAGPQTTFTVSGGIATDTTFILAASVTGDPSGDSPEGTYQTIYLYDALTLTVSNPALTPQTITSAGDVTVGGALSAAQVSSPVVTGTTVNATTAHVGTGGLSVAAATSIDGTLTVIGNESVNGQVAALSANITNAVTAGSATVSGALSAGSLSAGSTTLSGLQVNGNAYVAGFSATGVTTNGGGVYVNTVSNGSAIVGFNSSNQYTAGWTQNYTSSSDWVTGFVSKVASGGDCGFYTNGVYSSGSGCGMLVTRPTRDGQAVVTTPLSVAAEMQVTGTGRIQNGSGHVTLDGVTADLLLHTSSESYKVFLSPTSPCNGLTVTGKEAGRFLVEEVGGRSSEVTFDWLIIGRMPAALGREDAVELPDQPFEVQLPEPVSV